MTRYRDLLRIELIVECGDWSDIPTAAILDDVAAALVRWERSARGNAVVALANDAFVHDLNRRFRGIDRPTNVLSFPSGDAPGKNRHLGDIALAVETLRREAAMEGKPLSHHFTHLALHGLLHLLGYDHQSEAEALPMERLETELLAELGIPDPYASQTAALSHT